MTGTNLVRPGTPPAKPRAGTANEQGKAPRIHLTNRSGYLTQDLERFVVEGLRACGVTKIITVMVTASPIRSRGCAEVGGNKLSLAIASPSKFSRRRLARVLWHEAAHLRGIDHAQMDERLLYSLGPTPAWALRLPLRYRKRAPNQMVGLGAE